MPGVRQDGAEHSNSFDRILKRKCLGPTGCLCAGADDGFVERQELMPVLGRLLHLLGRVM